MNIYLVPAAYLLFIASVGWVIWYIARTVVQAHHIKTLMKRRRYLGQISTQSQITKATISEELDKVDMAGLIAYGQSWQIYDVIFELYRKNKNGRYKVAEAYYTVFEAKLQRIIPHLLFDSKIAKKRQFKHLYASSQKLSLGAGFEDHFETYTPKYYQIDALNLMTPEVMEAMLALREYDLEFVEDSLFCYAPLLEGEQLENFQRRGLNLYAKFSHHLTLYRDQYLSRINQKQSVTQFGRRLLASPTKSIWIAILSGLLLMVLVYLGMTVSKELLFNEVSLYALCFLIYFSASAITTVHKNKKREKEFLSAQRSPDKT